MHELDRRIAGVSCREVLLDLSELLDGELPASRVAQLHAHVAECRECERFGGVVGALVRTLRDAPPEALSPEVGARLHERISQVLSAEG